MINWFLIHPLLSSQDDAIEAYNSLGAIAQAQASKHMCRDCGLYIEDNCKPCIVTACNGRRCVNEDCDKCYICGSKPGHDSKAPHPPPPAASDFSAPFSGSSAIGTTTAPITFGGVDPTAGSVNIPAGPAPAAGDIGNYPFGVPEFQLGLPPGGSGGTVAAQETVGLVSSDENGEQEQEEQHEEEGAGENESEDESENEHEEQGAGRNESEDDQDEEEAPPAPVAPRRSRRNTTAPRRYPEI